nr:hypothetical protein L204_02272 [Cryptococcus depauperatus CBS 7855]
MSHYAVAPANKHKSGGLMRHHPSIRATERLPYAESVNVQVHYLQPAAFIVSPHNHITNARAITQGEYDTEGARISPVPEDHPQNVYEKSCEDVGRIEPFDDEKQQAQQDNSFGNPAIAQVREESFFNQHLPNEIRTPSSQVQQQPRGYMRRSQQDQQILKSASMEKMPPPLNHPTQYHSFRQPQQQTLFQSQIGGNSRLFQDGQRQPKDSLQPSSNRINTNAEQFVQRSATPVNHLFQKHSRTESRSSHENPRISLSASSCHIRKESNDKNTRRTESTIPRNSLASYQMQESMPEQSQVTTDDSELPARGSLQALVFDDNSSVIDFAGTEYDLDASSDKGTLQNPYRESIFNFTPNLKSSHRINRTNPKTRFVIPKAFEDHTSLLKSINVQAIWQERLKMAKKYNHEPEWADYQRKSTISYDEGVLK